MRPRISSNCLMDGKLLVVNGWVVPTTTSLWIRPSNGKILRISYQNFWILTLMEVFRYAYMTNCSTFTSDDWRLEVVWYFLDALIVIVGDWYSLYYFWYHELIGGWIFLLLDSFWGYVHCWPNLSLYLSFRSLPSGLSLSTLFTLPMTPFTLQRVVIFDLFNKLVFTRLLS